VILFDLETDTNKGVPFVTKLQVIALYDFETEQYEVYDNDRINEGVARLSKSWCLCGHNIAGYDMPVLRRLYPHISFTDNLIDTLVWARVVYPDIVKNDLKLFKSTKINFPPKYIGLYSLESFGARLGILKGDNSEMDWGTWTQEMSDYCLQDVKVNHALMNNLASKELASEAFTLEQDVAKIISRQILHGFKFDIDKANRLYERLISEREQVGNLLKARFGMWFVRDGKSTFVPKKNDIKKGYAAGCPLNKIKQIQFSPSSRHHIAFVMKKNYGWAPSQYTEGGEPILDEEVIKNLPYPEAPMIAEYLMLTKRCGQLAEGKQAWLKNYSELDGKIHGGVNSNGAVTGRMTHMKPNIAQVPKANKSTPYGIECRELFTVRSGYKLVGVDASGLELRCLGHFMALYDGGAYVKVILEGDIHTANQEAAELPDRDRAKRFIYAFLYGAGDALLGSLIGGGVQAGRKIRAKFLKKTKALHSLIDRIKLVVNGDAEKGIKGKDGLKGLDGRFLPVRSLHSALNTLLQSAGALIMKKALVILDENLQAQGFIPSIDYEFSANVHDEFQIEALEEIADRVGQMAVEAIRAAGEYFNFRCPLDGEYKVGNNWAETH
jgi:hypothetical protein